MIIEYTVMAKKKKTLTKGGLHRLLKGIQHPTVEAKVGLKPQNQDDEGSECGSFLDDDTEDFLPSRWKKDDEKGKSEHDIAENLSALAIEEGNAELCVELESQSTALNRSTCQQGSEISTVLTSSLVSTDVELPATTYQVTREIIELDQPAKSATAFQKAQETTISVIQFPPSPLAQKQTPLEELQAEIKSVKHQFEKEDRDLKSAKCQAGALRAEWGLVKKKHDAELEREREQLAKDITAKAEDEYRTIKSSYRDIKTELQNTNDELRKATTDLRAVRDQHEKVKEDKKELRRKLYLEKVENSNSKQEVDRMQGEISELTLSNGVLRLENTDLSRQCQRAEANPAHERGKNSSLRDQISDLYSEIYNLRDQLDITESNPIQQMAESSTSTSENHAWERLYLSLQDDYRKLRKKYDNVCNELFVAERNIKDYKDDVSQLKRELTSLKSEFNKTEKDLSNIKAQNGIHAQTIQSLDTQIAVLEVDRDLKAPLVKVAVDLRLRYLELARETVFKLSRGQVDRGIIMNGNNAANRGIGALDAVLFKLGVVPDEYMEDAKQIFEELYTVAPSDYGCYPPKALRLVDCRATLASLKPMNKGNGSIVERDQHDQIDNEIIDLHKTMAIEEIERSQQVEDMVTKLERLTDEIVEMDRSRSARRRHYVSPVR